MRRLILSIFALAVLAGTALSQARPPASEPVFYSNLGEIPNGYSWWDWSYTLNVSWAIDPGCYWRPTGLPARGRLQILNNTVCAENGSRIRGTFWRVGARTLSDLQWRHWLDSSTMADLVYKRHYNALRITFYTTSYSYRELPTDSVIAIGREIVDWCAKWGVYAFICNHTGFIGADTAHVRAWLHAVVPSFKDDPNVAFILVDEPSGDYDGDDHYGSWYDWTVCPYDEIAYHVSLFQDIRALAPETMLICYENMLSAVKLSIFSPKQFADLGQTKNGGIDWSNAAIGWHGYPPAKPNTWGDDTTEFMHWYDQLKESYPVMMTSWDQAEINQQQPYGFGNYGPFADTLEAHGMSWFELAAFPWEDPHEAILATVTSGTKYYVKTDGSDAADGLSESNAWQHLSKHSSLSPGDTLVVKAGTYAEQLNVSVSGTASQPVVIQALDPASRPVLNPASDADRSVQVTDKSYVQVKYLDLPHGADLDGSDHCVLYGDSVYFDKVNLNGNFGVLRLEGGSTFNTIRRCLVDRKDTTMRSGAGATMGDAINLYGTGNDDNLIDSNTVQNASHIGINVYTFGAAGQANSRNVIRANTVRRSHTCVSIQDGGAGNVVEYNLLYQPGLHLKNSGGTAWINGRCLQVTGQTDPIIRFNQVWDDTSTGTPHDSFWYSDLVSFAPTGFSSQVGGAFYNNTAWARSFESSSSKWPVQTLSSYSPAYTFSGIKFKNNILGRQTLAAAADNRLVYESDGAKSLAAIDTKFDANLFYSSGTPDTLVAAYYASGTYLGNFGLGYLQTSRSAYWTRNFRAYPAFYDTVSRGAAIDLRIGSTSPAVDAGVALTTTTGSGSGTLCNVADGTWFWGGNALVTGDSIKIGSSNPVQITSRSGNALTLSSSRTWNSLDSVWKWPFSGDHPDIGALELVTFSVPAVPPLVSPLDGLTGQETPVTLVWGSVPGASSYIIEVSAESDFDPLFKKDSTASVTYQVLLAYGTQYYWRVRSKNAAGYSAYATAWDFETAGPPIIFQSRVLGRIR